MAFRVDEERRESRRGSLVVTSGSFRDPQMTGFHEPLWRQISLTNLKCTRRLKNSKMRHRASTELKNRCVHHPENSSILKRSMISKEHCVILRPMWAAVVLSSSLIPEHRVSRAMRYVCWRMDQEMMTIYVLKFNKWEGELHTYPRTSNRLWPSMSPCEK